MPSRNCTRVDYPDEDVQVRVCSYLGSRHLDNLRRIDVEVLNGTVTLHGTVDSYYEKQIALSTCRRVAGVLSMVDQLSVAAEDKQEIDRPAMLI